MTDQQKLQMVMDKANKNGYHKGSITVGPTGIWLSYSIDASTIRFSVNDIIFSRDFLKAYYGEEKIDDGEYLVPRWESEGQDLVLEDDRIDYLYQSITK